MTVRRARTGRRTTIKDVAARAGVATSTVSRALSDPERVHPDTRSRIAEAVREVDYRAGARRRALPDSAPGAIALLIPDIANPFYAEITRGTQLRLRAAGFMQVLADTEESAAVEEQCLRQAVRYADGVVLVATRLSDRVLRETAQNTPVVLINRVLDGFASVCLDTGLGFRQAIAHLVSLGHRQIAYLSGSVGSWSDGVRWNAVKTTGREAGVRTVRIGPFAPTFSSGAAAADAALNSGATACIAFNDLLAIGMLQRLAGRGIDVPAQISVVGCDGVLGSELCNPTLTTVTGDLQRVGGTAMQMLLAMLAEPRRAPDTVALPTHLTVRGSTGAPAA